MKPRAYARLAFRIAALIPLVSFVAEVLLALTVFASNQALREERFEDWPELLVPLGAFALLSVPLILLWTLAPWLAKRTVPETGERGNDTSSDRLVADLLAVALCVVGLVMLWDGLTSLWAGFCEFPVHCGIGLALVFGARRLVGAMTWLRLARKAPAAETTGH